MINTIFLIGLFLITFFVCMYMSTIDFTSSVAWIGRVILYLYTVVLGMFCIGNIFGLMK